MFNYILKDIKIQIFFLVFVNIHNISEILYQACKYWIINSTKFTKKNNVKISYWKKKKIFRK